MRSYRQACALAKALDVIGDRWTLLIVRELLIRGSCRYTDLRSGLPGIATNLLAQRLRELDRAGVVRREPALPPVATDLFRLTAKGEELEAVVHAMGAWGAPFLKKGAKGDVFRTHWLTLPARLHLRAPSADRPPSTIEVRTGNESLLIETAGGSVRIRPGSTPAPDAVLTGPPGLVGNLLTGKVGLAEAQRAGLEYNGAPETLGGVLPPRGKPRGARDPRSKRDRGGPATEPSLAAHVRDREAGPE